MTDGNQVLGETAIRDYPASIKEIFLVPECGPLPETLQAISEADAIIIGPGSLYTSIIPNLLVKGIIEAITSSRAPKFYISNIMTEEGETDNFTAADHLRVIQRHTGKQIIDYAVVNSGKIDEERLKRYIEEKAVPVRSSSDEIAKMGINIIERDLVSDTEVAWHDADKLARVILETINMNC